jgi:hypothetical protein
LEIKYSLFNINNYIANNIMSTDINNSISESNQSAFKRAYQYSPGNALYLIQTQGS